jgi:hypothetical protein
LLWFGFLSAEKLWCEMKVELEYDLKRHEIWSEICYRNLLLALESTK